MVVPPNKVIGTLFSLMLVFGGITYTNAVSRISALEQDRKDLIGVAQAISIQTAVIEAKLSALEHGQDMLAAVITENTKEYQAALRRWEAILAKYAKDSMQ